MMLNTFPIQDLPIERRKSKLQPNSEIDTEEPIGLTINFLFRIERNTHYGRRQRKKDGNFRFGRIRSY